jgi:hypothetical protein
VSVDAFEGGIIGKRGVSKVVGVSGAGELVAAAEGLVPGPGAAGGRLPEECLRERSDGTIL